MVISDTLAQAKQHYSDKIDLENHIDDVYMLDKSDCHSGVNFCLNKYYRVRMFIFTYFRKIILRLDIYFD